MKTKPLRLKAADAEDLAIIASVLQDALVDLGQFAYDPGLRRFAGLVVRFLHEECQFPASGPLRQVKAALTFDKVRAVRTRGLDQRRGGVHELLTVTCSGDEEKGVRMGLLFAGGGAVRLEADTVACRLADVGDPWVSRLAPRHDTGVRR